jgi:hypothetical protein
MFTGGVKIGGVAFKNYMSSSVLMKKKVSYASYNCINGVFNAWFGIITKCISDQDKPRIIQYRIEINGSKYVASVAPHITSGINDRTNVLWINIIHEGVQTANEINCELIYCEDMYCFKCKPYRKLGLLVYEAFLRYVNTKMAELLNPRIFIHCWSEEVTIEIIRKVHSFIKPKKIILLKPLNIDYHAFEQIRKRAFTDFSLETEVLDVPPLGRDVGGFITALNKCFDQNAPDYNPNRPCLFLHAKNTLNIPQHRVIMWRNSLIDPLISRFRGFITLILLLLFRPAIIYSKDVHRDEPGSSLNIHQYRSLLLSRTIAKRIFGKLPSSFGYCAGTMMWVIPSQVSHIWTLSRLEEVAALLEPSETMTEPSHAHAFERLFPEMVRSGGGKCIRI